MSTEERGANINAGKEERMVEAPRIEQLAFLSSIHTLSGILADVGTFIRNNHMLYTAAFSRAMQELASGNPNGSDMMKSLDGILDHNTRYLKDISNLCVQTIADMKKLSE